MALCDCCKTIPFSSLPELQPSPAIGKVADDPELPIISWTRGDGSGDGVVGGERPLGDPIGFPWHADLHALAESSRSSGCPLCIVAQAGVQIWLGRYGTARQADRAWREHGGDDYQPAPHAQRLWLTRRPGGSPGFVVLAQNPAQPAQIYPLTGVGFVGGAGGNRSSSSSAADIAAPVFPSRLLDPDSGSAAGLDAAAELLARCVGSGDHVRCGSGDGTAAADDNTPLPPRVLDVGIARDDAVVHLVTVDGGRTGKYLCLSHCWGPDDVLASTRQLYAAHAAGIPLSSLPQTFRDAIAVTRVWASATCGLTACASSQTRTDANGTAIRTV